MKRLFVFIFLVVSFVLFSSQDEFIISISPDYFVLQPNIHYEDGIFQLYRNLTIEYPDFIFKYAEFDLSLKFLFNEKDCQIPSLQKEYEEILLVFEPLFSQQFEAFKYFFISYLKNHRKQYKFKEENLNDSQYLKDRYYVVIYNYVSILFGYEKLFISMSNEFKDKIKEKKLNYYNIKKNFEERPDSFIYYFCLLIKQIKPINEFFIKYVNALSNYKKDYYFNEIFDFIKSTFSIKSQEDLKIILDISPKIYFLKEGNKDNFLTNYDVDKYKEKRIYGLFIRNTSFIFLGLDNFKSKKYFLHVFVHEMTHYFQKYSSYILDNSYDKIYYSTYFPAKFEDYSGWHKFLSSFKDSKKYRFNEIDAVFTEYYITDLFCKKYPSFIMEDDSENLFTINEILIIDIMYYLLNKYIEYCKTNGISQIFYSQNADLTIGVGLNILNKDNPNNINGEQLIKNFTEFFEKWVYLNRIKMLYDIYRANKYFGFLLQD